MEMTQKTATIKQRLHYMDIAKGLLILMIIGSHIAWCSHENGVHNSVFDSTRIVCNFWNPFIMAAFFVITGFCSNFDKDYKQFFIKDAKTLLLPAITLELVRSVIVFLFQGGSFYYGMLSPGYLILRFSSFWFLVALFWSKQIYYFIRRINVILSVTVLILLFVIGSLLIINKVDERCWIFHAMVFVPFLSCGEFLKNRKDVLDKYLICIVPYVIIFIIYKIFFYNTSFNQMPYIAAVAVTKIWQLPIFMIAAVAGSVFIIAFSKFIDHNDILEYFGKNSLIIYCLHLTFMSIYYQLFASCINRMGIQDSVAALVVMLAFVILMMIVCSWLLNQKYLKWLLGKF